VTINPKTTGEIIKERRKELGMTQTDLAKKMGVTQAYISALEVGTRDNLTSETILKLANALNIYGREFLQAVVPDDERAEMIREDNAAYHAEEEDFDLAIKINQLTPIQRKAVEGVIDAFLSEVTRG
jgi:transcriptional regulator with XRE-family HTH domain